MYKIIETKDYEPLSVLFHDNGLEVKICKEIPDTALKLWKCEDENGDLIAACQLGKRRGHFVLESLAVDPAYRGDGLGGKLLRLAEKEAFLRGAKEIWLVAKVPEYYKRFAWKTVPSAEAPDISKCQHCAQFEETCHPAIMKKYLYSCIHCGVGNCDHMDKKYPDFCLTKHMDPFLKEEAIALYDNEENRDIMVAAAQIEYEYYCKMTRVEETVEFCRRMHYNKIGIATCVGLLHEANIFARILRNHGLEVTGIACKAGTVAKHEVGIPVECEAIGENMCNPILQAKKLNAEHTDFNVVIGLCVGHDSLFYKYSQAPVTTLLTKDRVLGHNPVAALYLSKSYYNKIMESD